MPRGEMKAAILHVRDTVTRAAEGTLVSYRVCVSVAKNVYFTFQVEIIDECCGIQVRGQQTAENEIVLIPCAVTEIDCEFN